MNGNPDVGQDQKEPKPTSLGHVLIKMINFEKLLFQSYFNPYQITYVSWTFEEDERWKG